MSNVPPAMCPALPRRTDPGPASARLRRGRDTKNKLSMGLDLEHARGIELLMALWEVKKSRRGQGIDLAQYEAVAQTNGNTLPLFTGEGEVYGHTGNSPPGFQPYDTFRCSLGLNEAHIQYRPTSRRQRVPTEHALTEMRYVGPKPPGGLRRRGRRPPSYGNRGALHR